MRLTKQEENQLASEGFLAVLVCLGILIAILWGGNYLRKEMELNTSAVRDTTINMRESNRKEAREIKFLRENEEAIEAMWATLKGWGGGVNSSSVMPLTEAELVDQIPLPPTKIPGNPTEYVGVRLLGERTEFQRLAAALSIVEAQEGLLQVRSATLALPGYSVPNGPRPTYLNIQVEVVGPLAK
jgi:hypothetical protein